MSAFGVNAENLGYSELFRLDQSGHKVPSFVVVMIGFLFDANRTEIG